MTPNCVTCSRNVEHTECTVLHLLDRGWVIERGPHLDPHDGHSRIPPG